MHRIDACAHACRWRRRNPLENLALSLGLSVLCLLLPAPGGLVVLVVAAALALLSARVPFGLWLRTVTVPLGFGLAGAVGLAFELRWNHGVALALSRPGLATAGLVLQRSAGAVAGLVLLALTTPVSELVLALRRCGCPELLTELMLLVYRMLFVLDETLEAMRTAQASRLGYATWRSGWRSVGLLGSAFLLRALDRARRLEAGLAARGFDGALRVLSVARPLRWRGLAGAAVVHLAVVAVTLATRRGLG